MIKRNAEKKRNKTQCKDVTLHKYSTSKAKIETLCVIEPNVQMPNDGDSERQRQLIANKHSQRHKHSHTHRTVYKLYYTHIHTNKCNKTAFDTQNIPEHYNNVTYLHYRDDIAFHMVFRILQSKAMVHLVH